MLAAKLSVRFSVALDTATDRMKTYPHPRASEGFLMLHLESNKGVESCDGLTRRAFLRVGAATAGAVGVSLADLLQLQQASAADRSADLNCILLFLVGGPSQLDTW